MMSEQPEHETLMAALLFYMNLGDSEKDAYVKRKRERCEMSGDTKLRTAALRAVEVRDGKGRADNMVDAILDAAVERMDWVARAAAVDAPEEAPKDNKKRRWNEGTYKIITELQARVATLSNKESQLGAVLQTIHANALRLGLGDITTGSEPVGAMLKWVRYEVGMADKDAREEAYKDRFLDFPDRAVAEARADERRRCFEAVSVSLSSIEKCQYNSGRYVLQIALAAINALPPIPVPASADQPAPVKAPVPEPPASEPVESDVERLAVALYKRFEPSDMPAGDAPAWGSILKDAYIRHARSLIALGVRAPGECVITAAEVERLGAKFMREYINYPGIVVESSSRFAIRAVLSDPLFAALGVRVEGSL